MKVVPVLFNTGRRYGPEGQRIAAVQLADGTVVFRDHDRMVSGVLTCASTYCGADSGGAKVFPPLTAAQVQAAVTERYCNGYAYQSSASARVLDL
jgi:hypothetical protein